ncbi:TrmH family RNA methyltransferase [Plebeiibacterium sediminum]|uniref:TrmH family RNA methyltransferase n=1 Tax=Plebeiibacterium sediminum TaxID=2992112 RepID=A0AAE3M1Z2_9BACT|nr:TrmH family RNA methyltransferase [Plebeiobacterium sediminum]MCW3785654.1 TrmH family RNA methyltransferase [Plebeiobacterium sediminum]
MNNESTKSGALFTSTEYQLHCEGPIIVAYQLKSPENMGHIIRLASNFGCKKVLFVGDEKAVRESKIRKVGGAATGQIDWCFVDEASWMKCIDSDYKLIAVETSDNSKCLTDIHFPEKTAFILGNEIYGLSDEVVTKCDQAVHIPMIGKVKSMNVSHACSVVLYEWVKQYLK